jgi:hypothetical protein
MNALSTGWVEAGNRRLMAEAERHAPSRGGAEMNGARIDGRSARLDD